MRIRRRPRESALVVPVPTVDGLVARVPGFQLPTDLPAHVTLMYPFVPPARLDASVEQAVAGVVGSLDPFPFELVALRRFPDVLYLEPRPADPFTWLMERLLARWPAHPPYGGRFAAFVPHVTVAPRPTPPGVVAALEAALPITCRGEEVALFAQDPTRRWRARWHTPLGAA